MIPITLKKREIHQKILGPKQNYLDLDRSLIKNLIKLAEQINKNQPPYIILNVDSYNIS